MSIFGGFVADFIATMRDLMALSLWVCSIHLYIYVARSALVDTSSFLLRDKALQEHLTAQQTLKDDPQQAAEHYTRSYELLANPLSARKLAWLHEMIGNHKQIWEWQQHYARNDWDGVLTHMNEGIRKHYEGDYQTAIEQYELAYSKDPSNPDALYLKGVTYQLLGDIHNAAASYYYAIELDPMHTKAILNLATLHQKYGSFDDSVNYYLEGIEAFRILEKRSPDDHSHQYLHPHNFMLQYNLGLAYYQRNELDKAYDTTIKLINRLLPIAQAVGDPLLVPTAQSDAEHHFDASLYNTWEITQSMGGALGSLSKIQRAALHWGKWEELHEQLVKYTLLGIAHTITDTAGLDAANEIVNAKIVYTGPLMPFDTLMMQLPLSTKLFIAEFASKQYTYVPHDASVSNLLPMSCSAESTENSAIASMEEVMIHSTQVLKCNRKLKLGFISYDFNDHPTAHLVEAIFQIINKHISGDHIYIHSRPSTSTLYDHVELIIFSYGKNDNSAYRKSLQRLAHKFVDIVESSFTSAADAIRAENIDILLDMQIHTLGSRLEITSSGVAPIVINYLVYPGTSGAKFYNYLICDAVVVPPEHSTYYSEALLMLPATYQISTYEGYTAQRDVLAAQVGVPSRGASVADIKMALRRYYNLPQGPGDIIFCNFNKISKIDPESFALWVQILRTLPKSYLWLLDPTKEGSNVQSSIKTTLLRSFVAAGVAANRMLFAPRVGKNAHIYRHGAADLFLDTIVYGAHSTATDALRGGLPVLTLVGDSFPSRVVASLYKSFIHPHHSAHTTHVAAALVNNILVVDSAKQFVDAAVRLVRNRFAQKRAGHVVTSAQYSDNRSDRLTQDIHDLIAEQAGLFDAGRNVRTFVYSMEAVQETAALKVHLSGDSTPSLSDYHIVLL